MKTRVAAAQLPFAYLASPQEFVDLVREPIERAARERAELIVLPHYLTYALLGMFLPDVPPTATLDDVAQQLRFRSVAALMQERGAYLYDFHIHIFQSLAERTNTWLAPGTAPEVVDEEWFNTALLFSPDGKIVGRQRQTHRSVEERAWELSAGDELRVITTDVGRIGIVIGEDVRYPEVSRILALQGANILVHPAATRVDHAFASAPDEQFLVDLWREVQSNQVFGVQANLVGASYRGRSAIYTPVDYKGDRRGILAQAQSDSATEVVAAELDFEALQKVVDEYPIFDFFNHELYQRFGRQ